MTCTCGLEKKVREKILSMIDLDKSDLDKRDKVWTAYDMGVATKNAVFLHLQELLSEIP